MKIHTLNDLQDSIDAEMAWRKHELSAIRENVASARKSSKDTAIRAGIALLYAHWEGAVKNIATYYLEYVAMLKLPYGALKPNFLAISLKYNLKTFEESSKTTIHTEIVSKIIDSYDVKSKIPVEGIIKTNSNLNSEVFVDIMATIGLDCSAYEGAYKLIDTVLLEKRNKVAHGERVESLDLDEARYYEIHEKIRDLILQFADQVSNAASLQTYLNHSAPTLANRPV